MKALWIALMIILCEVVAADAQQLKDGNYLFPAGNDDTAATQLLGKYAISTQSGKKPAEPGRVFAAVRNTAENELVKTSDNPPRIVPYKGKAFDLRSTLTSTGGGTLSLSGFGMKGELDLSRAKSVDLHINKIHRLATFTKSTELLPAKICKTRAGGKEYSGDLLITSGEGLNYVSRVYEGDGTLRIYLKTGGGADISGAFKGIDVGLEGGVVKGDTVTFDVKEAWSIVYVENINKDYCQKLKGKSVPK